MSSLSRLRSRPHGRAPVDTVCCWCQPEKAARLETSEMPRVRFGICRHCLDERLQDMHAVAASRADTRVRAVS